jgi:putative transposase
MDGSGRWVENVFVERLWRSVKYEDIYLKAHDSLTDTRHGIIAYFEFYNSRRRHQGLDDRTPDEVYFITLPQVQVAA